LFVPLSENIQRQLCEEVADCALGSFEQLAKEMLQELLPEDIPEE
jgi:hypothetical protein